ncbi:MAG: hypothetical protein HOK84_15500, partial [Bacteroidetes bacterium]|nr:hypothetical protein [Bacteroidota bacterium]
MKVLKTSLLVVILLSLYLNLKAQENSIQGYIIALGEDKVTLDLKKGQVTKGDLVKVIT